SSRARARACPRSPEALTPGRALAKRAPISALTAAGKYAQKLARQHVPPVNPAGTQSARQQPRKAPTTHQPGDHVVDSGLRLRPGRRVHGYGSAVGGHDRGGTVGFGHAVLVDERAGTPAILGRGLVAPQCGGPMRRGTSMGAVMVVGPPPAGLAAVGNDTQQRSTKALEVFAK